MYFLIIILLSCISCVILGGFIYKKDKNKEPKKIIFKMLLWGGISCIPAAIIESTLSDIFCPVVVTMKQNLIENFLIVALTEEVCKFLVAYYIGIKKEHFDETYDAIVYCVFSAAGFTILEDLFYNFLYGVPTAILRALTPGHLIFGSIMGYFIGMAYKCKKNNLKGYKSNLAYSLIVPTLLHGIYDFALFYSDEINNGLLTLIMFTGLILFVIAIVKDVLKTSATNDNFSSNNISNKGFKYLVFEIILLVILCISSLSSEIYTKNDKVFVSDDNFYMSIKDYDIYKQDYNKYFKINLVLENNSSSEIKVNNDYFSAMSWNNRKALLKVISQNYDSSNIVIDGNGKREISFIFEITDEKFTEEDDKLLLIYSKNAKKEYVYFIY